MKKMTVKSLNISEKKGTVKTPVEFIQINEKGVTGDAHAGRWHRQVSLLPVERIVQFSNETGKDIHPGEFAENITTEGLDFSDIRLLDRFTIGDVVLQVSQIGKSCHGSKCAIYQEVGTCIMPKEGVFTRVLQGGKIKTGDSIEFKPENIGVKIITLSDRASAGEYADLSGPQVEGELAGYFKNRFWRISCSRLIIPDNKGMLETEIKKAVHENCSLIFTTGGTGISSSDITTDVLQPLLSYELPGIMNFIRNKYGSQNPNALISRSMAGVIGKSLIFALPGSVKAVKEYMSEIVTILEHSLLMIHDVNTH